MALSIVSKGLPDVHADDRLPKAQTTGSDSSLRAHNRQLLGSVTRAKKSNEWCGSESEQSCDD